MHILPFEKLSLLIFPCGSLTCAIMIYMLQQTALLHRPHVVRAFEQEHDQQVSLKHTLSVLEDQRQQTLSETLRLTRRIRSQASSASSSRLDQPML